MGESCDESRTNCGGVCDQHMRERKSWEMEINGHMMGIARRRQRQEHEWEGCEKAQEYTN